MLPSIQSVLLHSYQMLTTALFTHLSGHLLDIHLRKVLPRQPQRHASCHELFVSCRHCSMVTVLPLIHDTDTRVSALAFPPYRLRMSLADGANGAFTATWDLLVPDTMPLKPLQAASVHMQEMSKCKKEDECEQREAGITDDTIPIWKKFDGTEGAASSWATVCDPSHLGDPGLLPILHSRNVPASCDSPLATPAYAESITWLCDVLLPKLAAWATNIRPPLDARNETIFDRERYAQRYEELKTKYGLGIAKVPSSARRGGSCYP